MYQLSTDVIQHCNNALQHLFFYRTNQQKNLFNVHRPIELPTPHYEFIAKNSYVQL